MNRLEGSDQRDVQLEQVKVCTKIGMECMESDPKKRPDASHIIDRLEKMSSTETGISSSSVEKEVSFQKDHYCQGKIANLSPDYLGKDIKEHAETEELGEYGGTLREDCWQQGLEEDLCDQWSLQGVEDTKQTVSSQGASISGSNSGVLYKLKNLNFFNRKKIRREYAKNGGPTVASAKTIKLFKNKELKPFFKSSDLIFKDDFGEVYEGFVDNVPVTLRKLIDVENDSFENEVIIQARVIHKNIVRLIGCCLESDNPILVYELFSEKNLQDLLHSNNKVPLNFGARLSIAATSAGALAYMHSVANRGILHGDFKPANILFDDNFVLKISYFGMLRMTSIDIIGDTTYMDPVYLQTGSLTEKSDVYSFGVVMLELLTRKKATLADNNSLVKNFLDNHTEGRKLTELYDKEIAVTGDLDLIDNMAEIATECLSLDMSRRPRMIDVAKRLSILNRSHKLEHQQAS